MHDDAVCTAIDLRGADFDEIEQSSVQAAGVDIVLQPRHRFVEVGAYLSGIQSGLGRLVCHVVFLFRPYSEYGGRSSMLASAVRISRAKATQAGIFAVAGRGQFRGSTARRQHAQ